MRKTLSIYDTKQLYHKFKIHIEQIHHVLRAMKDHQNVLSWGETGGRWDALIKTSKKRILPAVSRINQEGHSSLGRLVRR